MFDSKLDQMNKENTEMWKRAVRLNLLKNINNSKLLLKHQKSLSSNQKQNLQKGADQLSIVLSMMEKENNPLIFEKMSKDPYTRQSVGVMRQSVKKIISGVNKLAFRQVFQTINWRKLKPIAFRNRFDDLEKNSPLISNAVQVVKSGDFLDKYHYTTAGSRKQYFQVVDDTLRWTSKKSNITKVRACHVSNHPP